MTFLLRVVSPKSFRKCFAFDSSRNVSGALSIGQQIERAHEIASDKNFTRKQAEVSDQFESVISDELKSQKIDILQQEGSLEFARNYLISLHSELIDSIRAIDCGSPLWEKTMNEVLSSVLTSEAPLKMKTLVSF
jgi:hypothetical protein